MSLHRILWITTMGRDGFIQILKIGLIHECEYELTNWQKFVNHIRKSIRFTRSTWPFYCSVLLTLLVLVRRNKKPFLVKCPLLINEPCIEFFAWPKVKPKIVHTYIHTYVFKCERDQNRHSLHTFIIYFGLLQMCHSCVLVVSNITKEEQVFVAINHVMIYIITDHCISSGRRHKLSAPSSSSTTTLSPLLTRNSSKKRFLWWCHNAPPPSSPIIPPISLFPHVGLLQYTPSRHLLCMLHVRLMLWDSCECNVPMWYSWKRKQYVSTTNHHKTLPPSQHAILPWLVGRLEW